MLKKLLCLLTALAVLLMTVPVLAVDNGPDPLTMAELTDWAAALRAMTAGIQPLNDPHDADALTEDGYAFVYSFGILYFDAPELTDDATLLGGVLYDTDFLDEEHSLRTTGIGLSAQAILDAFYNENPTLDGSREQAVLYLTDDLALGGSMGMVLRDGQRIQAISYELLEPLSYDTAPLYASAGVIYTLDEGYVSAIRLYGLDSACTQEEAANTLAAAGAARAVTGYTQVPTSFTGDDLTMFGPADMAFSGIDLSTVTPESASQVLGVMLEDIWNDNDGGYIRTVDFASCQMTFTYDADRQNSRLMLLDVTEDAGFEGPRAVRVGDTLSSVVSRFRSGDGSFDGTTEVLYGDPASAPFAVAQYGSAGSAILRYAAPMTDGRTVVLMITFEQLTATEMMIYFND